MEDQVVVETPVYPVHIKTFSIPNDAAVKRAFNVYKPSPHTIQLLSEKGREVYPELFSQLSPLTDLCVMVLARSFGPKPMPMVAENPSWLQVHYDALDVDLPLAMCYDISQERFWKRLVLAKHKDTTLAIKSNVNWKNMGVSLKYVELVEKCAAEYWPEEEMNDLAIKVKEFVTEMQIRRLQSLKPRSFEKFFQSESETSSEESSDEEESDSLKSTSTEEEIEELEEEEKTASQLELEKEMALKEAERKQQRQELREAKQKAREEKKKAREEKRKAREARRMLREARLAALEEEEPPIVKKPKKRIRDLFAVEISESEDEECLIVDKRNKELFLRKYKKYNYPPQDCHHIDLTFLQHFVNLETFIIEFLGPMQNRNYHSRHFNFSYGDIKRLGTGLSRLDKLKVFRLRNSRMDAKKLRILLKYISSLPSLETLDFGNDQLKDDCGSIIEEFFQTTESLKNLELESNFLGEDTLRHIGKALSNYNANELLYLGLARNPISDNALHALVSLIVGTKHIEQLNIRGCQFLTDIGLCCCIAHELLRQHPNLIKLDVCAIRISPLAAKEIMISLLRNQKILQFNCYACELDDETEIDVNVILKRNKYISENYYVGNEAISNEEIEEWLNRPRHPIQLKVLAERESDKQCLQNRPVEPKVSTHSDASETSCHSFFDVRAGMYGRSGYAILDEQAASHTSQPYVYPSDNFDEKEFLEHVYQPGPPERFYYFKMCKQKYMVRSNVKNKSMI